MAKATSHVPLPTWWRWRNKLNQTAHLSTLSVWTGPAPVSPSYKSPGLKAESQSCTNCHLEVEGPMASFWHQAAPALNPYSRTRLRVLWVPPCTYWHWRSILLVPCLLIIIPATMCEHLLCTRDYVSSPNGLRWNCLLQSSQKQS